MYRCLQVRKTLDNIRGKCKKSGKSDNHSQKESKCCYEETQSAMVNHALNNCKMKESIDNSIYWVTQRYNHNNGFRQSLVRELVYDETGTNMKWQRFDIWFDVSYLHPSKRVEDWVPGTLLAQVSRLCDS